MNIRAAFLMILASTSAPAVEWVGKVVPPYPKGFSDDLGGTCISAGLGADKVCAYAFEVVSNPKGSHSMILGKRSIPLAVGNPSWIVVDAIPYPRISSNYYLAMGLCKVNGKMDDTIIAAVRVEDSEWFSHATWARRLDIKLKKFVEISPDGIQCINDGWGAD